MATDLRFLLTVLRIAPELERSHDLAEHIARRSMRGLSAELSPRVRGIIEQMGRIGVEMWRTAADAWIERNADVAEELDDVDDEMLTVSHLLRLVRLDDPLPELKEQADILVQMAKQACCLIDQLEPMRGIEPYLDAVDRLESEGDAVFRRIQARLF